MAERFTYMCLRFDVDRAREILKDREIHDIASDHRWSPMVKVDEEHAKTVDLNDPVFIAQVVLDGERVHMMIDGHHRNRRACKEGVAQLKAKLLTVEETLDILEHAFPAQLTKMKREAKKWLKGQKSG